MAARLVGKPSTGSDQSQKQGHIKTKHYFPNFSQITRGLVFILKDKQPVMCMCFKQTKAACTHLDAHANAEHTNAARPHVFVEREQWRQNTGGARLRTESESWRAAARFSRIWIEFNSGKRNNCMSSSCHGSQAALLAAPTPHGKYTSLTDRGSGVTGPHNRPAWAS